nr:thaumatin-like protein [Zostera marina]
MATWGIHLLLLPLLFTITSAATFTVINKCSYTVWAGAVPGGGMQMNPGQRWTLNVPAGTAGARIWPRTGCNFDGSGRGSCQTGDCGGVLKCTGFGKPPNTLAEYALNQYSNLDFFDISLVDGFNVPLEFQPTSGCNKWPTCSANLNNGCPGALQTSGGCNNPCTVFKTDQYCCTNNYNCQPTTYSKYFKQKCPTSYSYPKDDPTSTFTCPGGTNYNVIFCP